MSTIDMQLKRDTTSLSVLTPGPKPAGRGATETGVKRSFGFYLVLISLLVEFGRPQDIIPGIKLIPFPSIIDLLIGLSVVVSGKLNVTNRQTKLYIALLALMVMHVPLATNNYWALMILKDMFLYFCFFLGLVCYVDTIAKMKTLVTAWLTVHLVLAILGLMNGGKGVGGWLGDENDFCMEMNVAVPFAYFMLLGLKHKASKMWYLGLLCIFVLTAMVTLSRGGFIGLAAVGTYCWLKSAKKGRAVLLAGLVVIFMLMFAPEKYWDEIASSTSEETMTVGTGAARLHTWGIGWEMFLGNPVFGVGQGNFPWNVEEYEGANKFLTRSFAGRAAHSMYLTLLPELGSIGTMVFMVMVFSNFSTVNRIKFYARKYNSLPTHMKVGSESDRLLSVALCNALEAAMVGYLVSSVFISTLYYPTFWVITGFIVALGNTVDKTNFVIQSPVLSPKLGLPIQRSAIRPKGTPRHAR